jgi:hypothetical protein
MPINPNIALGVQPIQIADPMARYSQLSTIQNAQNQNALAQYQLGAAKRTEDVQNVLADAYSQSTDPATGEIDYNKLTKIVAGNRAGAQIPAILKTRREMEQSALTQRETGFKVEKAKNEFIAQAKRDTSQNPSDANLTAFKEDLIANPLFNAAEKTQMAANVDRILAMPVDQRRSFMASQGASAGELKPTVQTVNRDGQTDVLRVPAFSGAPTTLTQLADVPLPSLVEAQKSRIGKSSAANITMTQEKAFEGGLGKGQADRIIASQVAAQDAAAIIDTVKTGRDIMKSGMITGAGADFLVNLNQGLKTAGIDAGYADAAANSQAFAANMAGNVGKLIKQFGAGTGLSDADREFAKDMAGGRISLDAKAINRILDINERAARNTITRHNKDVKGIKTNIPLEVEMPPAAPSAPVVTAPAAAIDYLRANPSMKGAFDTKYGAGAADRALKGQ